MELDIYQVDAFTDEVFRGNPAAIVPLTEWLPDDMLRRIAMENNLSETAFYVPQDDGSYHLRWFTPTTEVELCGHATMATSHVIFHETDHSSDEIRFTGQSGELIIRRDNDKIVMDFPVWDYEEVDIPDQLVKALGVRPTAVFKAYDWVVLYDDENIVRNIKPDMKELIKFEEARGVLPTAAASNGIDFVSRMFCPRIGIDEDPVTGSAHCILVPFWAERLGKSKLHAYQASERGGYLHCELKGDRVIIAGQTKLYMKGKIYV